MLNMKNKNTKRDF